MQTGDLLHDIEEASTVNFIAGLLHVKCSDPFINRLLGGEFILIMRLKRPVLPPLLPILSFHKLVVPINPTHHIITWRKIFYSE